MLVVDRSPIWRAVTNKKFITFLAIALNCLVLYPALLLAIYGAFQDLQQTQRWDSRLEIGLDDFWGTPTAIKPRGTAVGKVVTSVAVAFCWAVLPFLGAFISNAKGRGRAEGYNLVTFFGPIGLIVALCLPRSP
jgi:hypothetical protein